VNLPFTSATLAVHSFHKIKNVFVFFRQLNDTVYIGGDERGLSYTKSNAFYENNLISSCAAHKRTFFDNKVLSLGSYVKITSHLVIPILDESLHVKAVVYSRIDGCTDAEATIKYISDNWSALTGIPPHMFLDSEGSFGSDHLFRDVNTSLQEPFVSSVNHALQISSFKETIDPISAVLR
jgi:hypothetical protein